MIKWLAPGGLIIVEVPNVSGWGGQLFGKHWSGLELPRHLIQFSPETMRAMVERAGGLVIKAQHNSKPRYFMRSLRYWLQDGAGIPSRLALTLLKSRIGAGLLKLSLEGLLPIAELLKQGEVVRYFIRRRGESRPSRAAWRPNKNELTAGAG